MASDLASPGLTLARRSSETPPADQSLGSIRSAERVGIVVYDGLCPFEFAAAVAAFVSTSGPCDLQLASLKGPVVRGLGGFRLVADGRLDVLKRADTIVIPGWKHPDCAPPKTLVSALSRAHARGARLASISWGVFVLATAGLLRGRRAAVHADCVSALSASYPDTEIVTDVPFVYDDRILTTTDVIVWLRLGLHLIREDIGESAAQAVARRIGIMPHFARDRMQLAERFPLPNYGDSRLSTLLARMRKDLASVAQVPDLAREAGMSTRNFLRHFRRVTGYSPTDWLMRERLQESARLVITTGRSIDSIARACGFGTTSNFRRQFRRHFGSTPNAYRRVFVRLENENPAKAVKMNGRDDDMHPRP